MAEKDSQILASEKAKPFHWKEATGEFIFAGTCKLKPSIWGSVANLGTTFITIQTKFIVELTWWWRNILANKPLPPPQPQPPQPLCLFWKEMIGESIYRNVPAEAEYLVKHLIQYPVV